MDCGVTFAKYAVFIFNFCFALAGIGLIAVGVVVRAKIADFNELFDGNFTSLPIFLILIGCIIFVIAFLGCCGAIKESTTMLFLFSIILIIIVAFEVAIIWQAYSKKGDLENSFDDKLLKTIRESANKKVYHESWHVLQAEFKCCGVNGKGDWEAVSSPIPGGCCQKKVNETCSTFDPNIYDHGCKAAFVDFLKSNLGTIGAVAIGVALIEILGIVFACCLYSVYRREVY